MEANVLLFDDFKTMDAFGPADILSCEKKGLHVKGDSDCAGRTWPCRPQSVWGIGGIRRMRLFISKANDVLK